MQITKDIAFKNLVYFESYCNFCKTVCVCVYILKIFYYCKYIDIIWDNKKNTSPKTKDLRKKGLRSKRLGVKIKERKA